MLLCLFSFCENNTTNIDNSNNLHLDKDIIQKNEVLILQIIKTIQPKQLPGIVNKYLLDNKSADIDILDNNSVKFYEKTNEELIQIKLYTFNLKDETAVVCVSALIYEKSNFITAAS